MNQKTSIILTDTASGGASVATSHLMDGLESYYPSAAKWWHFSPPSPLTENLATLSLDPRHKRPPLERFIKNFHRPWADLLRQKRHRSTFHQKLSDSPPTLLNCHNIHSSGLSHDDLLKVPRHIPIVWTMHDCWAFDIRAFEWTNQVTGENEFLCDDLPHSHAKERRRKLFAERPDIILVAPSRWLASEARASLGDDIRIETIPYGVCSKTFKPTPASSARETLKLNLDPNKVWLGIAATHAYGRKGLDVLASALAEMNVEKFGILSWGQKPDLAWPARLEVQSIGPVSDKHKLASLYSACDIFVCPSRSDNLPNTVLESLACGVPVIGSDAGGIPDMVRPGQTGWLFRSDNPGSCREIIQAAISVKSSWESLGQSCRQVALQDYSIEKQAVSYSVLFEEISTS